MDLYFLGTGAGVPSKERNVSSIALRLLPERGTIWLFDCGEATQQQIFRAPIKLSKIEKIFITHLHGDHIFGLPGLLASRSFHEGAIPLTVYGPAGMKQFIETALSVSGTNLRYPLEIVEVHEGTVFSDENYIVKAGLLLHGVTSYGYRVIESDHPGELDVKQLKADGVAPGPMYKQLKNGEKVTLENDTVIDGENYVGTCKPGRKVAILGDTRPCDQAIELARDVNVLVHEATFQESAEVLANEYFHSTTVQAARTAQTARASALIFTHISPRYKGRQAELLKEAKAVFPNSLIAEDHWMYDVKLRR